MLVFNKLLSELKSPKQKLYLICSKVEDIFATVFRQIVMTNFELLFITEENLVVSLSSGEFDKYWITSK